MLQPLFSIVDPVFLDAVLGTPGEIGLTTVSLAAISFATIVVKLAVSERREEREVRAKEAAATQAALEVARDLMRRVS